MKQLHFRDTFRPRHMKDLTKKERKEMLESHMFLKQRETEMSRDATWLVEINNVTSSQRKT